MKEIEAKFLDIDVKEIQKKIKLHGGKKIHKLMLYRRYVFDLMDNKNGYIRARQENNKTTITIKTYSKHSKFADEHEIEVNSTLDEARDFLIAQGYKLKHYHETLREKWSLGECHEIAIDYIPGIPTYIELECKNENAIKKIAKLLDLNMDNAEYDAYWKLYVDYYAINTNDIISKTIPTLTFKNIDKELKNFIIKNHDLVKTVKNNQLEIIKKNKIILKY
jgi:adenylate cyclase class IV